MKTRVLVTLMPPQKKKKKLKKKLHIKPLIDK